MVDNVPFHWAIFDDEMIFGIFLEISLHKAPWNGIELVGPNKELE